MKLQNPWPSNKRVTSPYGYRIHPITGGRKMHRGVDVAKRFDVTAAGDGIVHSKGYNAKGGGHWLKIDHGSGIYSVYYHGASASDLNKGQRVKAGDFIYKSGSTGASTGDHLHFEIRKGSAAWGNDVDPMPYLSDQGDGPGASSLTINGRLDRNTIRKWQSILQSEGFEPGLVDGRLGTRTISAIQRSVGVKPSGTIGDVTARAVQKHLGLREDGVWGRITVSAIQTRLNTGRWSK